VDFDLMSQDAWTRLDEVARALIDRSGQSDSPDELFHYTSPEGLIGIIGSRSLWASDMLCLNDSSEATYAHGLIQDALDMDNGRLLPPKHRSQFEEGLRSAFRMYPPFVTCFCENGDLLSQWRGYGGAGEGFALGFRRSWLTSSAVLDDAKFCLVKVIYCPNQQKRLITEFIESSGSISTTYQFSDDDAERWFWGITANAIAHLVVAIKDPVFEQENEWRLINTTIIPGENYRYRVSGHRIVPYVKIPVDADAVTSLVRGPRFKGDRGAEDMIRYGGFSVCAINVRNSEIPLRP
jgi:hypothetical protein